VTVGADDALDRLPAATWRALAFDLAAEVWGEDAPEGEVRARLASRTDVLKLAGLVERAAPKSYPRADTGA
jgi:hypothetical protein